VELLVNLITDADPLVQQNTLETITQLAADCMCRISLNESNVIAPLLEVLKSDYPAIQALALQVLYVVCQEQCISTSVKENNGL